MQAGSFSGNAGEADKRLGCAVGYPQERAFHFRPHSRADWPIRDGLQTCATPDRLQSSMAALRPRARGSVPHRGKNLAAKKLDTGEDLVLAHPRPTHAHREMIDTAAMLGDQHIDDA